MDGEESSGSPSLHDTMDTNPYAPPKAAVADAPLLEGSLYFWKINDLKRRLAAAPLSDREALPYYVAYNALAALTMLIPAVEFNQWDWTGGVITLAFAILGPIWVYKRNGGSAGIQFLQRVLALGLVMSLRIFAMAMAGFFVFHMIVAATSGETPGTDWYDVMLIAGLQFALYARIGIHIRDVAIGAPQPAVPTRPA